MLPINVSSYTSSLQLLFSTQKAMDSTEKTIVIMHLFGFRPNEFVIAIRVILIIPFTMAGHNKGNMLSVIYNARL